MSLTSDLAKALPGLRASEDIADRAFYARDLWPRHHLAVRAGNVARAMPACIAWPESTEEVARVIRFCAAEGIHVVPFGAGSGVCAGVLPEARAVILDLKRMAKIRNLNPDAPSVDVESGFMGLPFEEAMNRRGFTLGHFPSSILCSTVGGWVATRGGRTMLGQVRQDRGHGRRTRARHGRRRSANDASSYLRVGASKSRAAHRWQRRDARRDHELHVASSRGSPGSGICRIHVSVV